MFTDRINKLKNKINDYVASGGSMYAGRRELPYYKYMSLLKRDMEEQFGVTLTMEYMYALCGIKFDREFNRYREVCENLADYADENGCIDSIRSEKVKQENAVYSELKELSRKNNVSLMDYVFFMTPYHFTVGRIQGDSIAKLKRDLLKAYPTRDITGIRWQNKKLYERIKGLQLSMPENLSRQELIQFLGFTNDKFSSSHKGVNIKEEDVINELRNLYPDRSVSNLTRDAKPLYYKIVRLALAEDLTIEQWLNNKGFNYVTAISGVRLSYSQISFKDRANELLPIKKKYEKKFLKSNMSETDKYYAKLQVMKHSLEEYEKNEAQFDEDHGLNLNK